MILGMTTATFTLVHVLLSLIGIGSGLIILFGLIARKQLDRWTALFLATTLLTSVTGFAFPFHGLTPAHVLGVISLLALALAIPALYVFRLAGKWRRTYIVSSSIAIYLNSFVGVVQAFQKVPALKAMAPTQSEAPFVVAQLSVLVICSGLGALAAIKFREGPARMA